MDRDLIYPGQIGLVENMLDAFKSAMIGIGITSEAVLGQSTQVFGLAATPLSSTAVAGNAFAVSIGRGAIFSYQQTDSNAYGVLGTDTTNILKTGINLGATSVGITNANPPAFGYSINYLICGQFQEIDANPVGVPFYSTSGIPTTSLENLTRTQRVVFSVTGGTVGITGSQTTPAAPAGSVPLYVVTITNGQTAVTAGDISVAPGAPFIVSLSSVNSQLGTNTSGLAAEVATRSSQAGNMKTAINIYSTTTLTVSQQGSFVEIAAGSAITLTFPTPVSQAGAFWRVFNSSTFSQTLKTSAGLFSGPGGNGVTTITLLPGQLIELTSDNVTWVVSSVGSPAAHYRASQSGSLSIAAASTYTIASVAVTFPAYSKTSAFRVRGRMVVNGSSSGTGSYRQNFQSNISDGTNTVQGANWLESSDYSGDSWGFSDYYESSASYAAGASATFTMKTQTAGGNGSYTVSGSYFELFVIEA